MMKNVLAVLMAVALLLLLTACKKDPAGQTSGSSVAGESPNTSLKLPDLTLTNKTVKILRTMQDNHAEDEAIDLFAAKYGGSIEKILSGTGGDTLTKLSQMVLSNDAPDLVGFEGLLYFTAISKNLFQPVNGIVDLNNPIFSAIKGSGMENYMVGEDYYLLGAAQPRWVCWYNQKIFDDAGVDSPLKFYKEGTWTWGKLEELAKQLTLDTNKDKTTDVYGYGDAGGVFASMLQSMNTDFVKVDNGKLVNNMNDPNLERAFATRLRLKNAGAVYPQTAAYEAFKKGEMAMFEGGLWASSSYGFQDQVANGSMAFVPMPRDEQSDKYYYSFFGAGYAVAEGAKNTDGTNAFLSCLWYIYNLRESDESYAERELNRYKADTGFTDQLLEIWNGVKTAKNVTPVISRSEEIGGVDGWLGQMWKVADDVLVNGKAWATVRDQYSPILDSEIGKIQS